MGRAELRKLVLATGCAIEHEGAVFLASPTSSVSERAQMHSLIHERGMPLPDGLGWLCLPTGGSSGRIQFARHDEHTLGAAVQGFCTHFGVRQVNALDVLPAYHVSGLMARCRSMETGGHHVQWTWKQLEAGAWPDLPDKSEGWFLSLVPTQLHRLLADERAVGRLRQFRTIFLGGGPLWPALARRAADEDLPVAVCYGMTETAAMVVAQRPGDFLAGDRSCGHPMIHARVEIVDEDCKHTLPAGETGLVRISGASVFRGFWPAALETQTLDVSDFGHYDAEGRLTVIGRADDVIITGGKKVHPVEVEDALRTSGEFADVAVIGLPDPEWGRAVVACYPSSVRDLDTARVEQALASLSAYKRPKRFVPVSPWPRNAQGKLNRATLVVAALDHPA